MVRATGFNSTVLKLLWTLFAAFAPPGNAQGPFRSETNVVQVPVTVTDEQGRNVEGLAARDFQLLDGSSPRSFSLDLFGRGTAPISLVIAIQSSALNKVRNIAGLIQHLVIGREGEAALLTFSEGLQWHQDFTHDSHLLEQALREAKSARTERSQMYDAVSAAVNHLNGRRGRKVLLLIANTPDGDSRITQTQLAEKLARDGVEIYGLSQDAPGVQNLAEITGGSDYSLAGSRAAEKAIERMGAEVHSQYILSFAHTATAAGLHRLQVRTPGRNDLRIRARAAYWTD